MFARGKVNERGLRPLSLRTPLFRDIQLIFSKITFPSKGYVRNIDPTQITPNPALLDTMPDANLK
jgi:hypothetical protein